MKTEKIATMVVISGLMMDASVAARAAMPVNNIASPNHVSVIAVANNPLFATVRELARTVSGAAGGAPRAQRTGARACYASARQYQPGAQRATAPVAIPGPLEIE
jgi:hypothetical protein